MKNIAFIHRIFPGGGAERVTLDIIEHLHKFRPDYRCHVFTSNIIEDLYTDQVKSMVSVVKVSRLDSIKNREVEHLVKSRNIDLLVQVVEPLTGIKDICKRCGCKSIFANHGEPFWQQYGIIERRRTRLTYKLFWHLGGKKIYVQNGHARSIAIERTLKHYNDCDVYTVLCEEYKQETCEAFGINTEESKIRVIENAERTVQNVSYDKEKIIMFCGRLENVSKRIDRLLRIWGKIQHRLPNYRLQIVGDGKYRKTIEKQIIKDKLERIELTGRQSDVDKFYRKASIVCLTSQTEGWGLALTEAQAHGCIAVAFGCSSGVKNILSPSGTNGFIVPPFDEDLYAETLVQIASMSAQEQSAIRHSAVAKRAEYTPEIIMKKWETLFDELLYPGKNIYPHMCQSRLKDTDTLTFNRHNKTYIPMKKICAITMVRNDDFYLRKWVEYYGTQLGKENLRIYFDGEDQQVPDFCDGVYTELKPRIPGMVVKSEKERLFFLSNQASHLMREEGYDLIIGIDADEFLVVDPKLGKTLPEYLSSIDIDVSVSGLGVDVGQHLDHEKTIDASKPFLSQRRYAYLCSRYTKPSVISQPVRWGSGFHRIKGHNYHIDENLFLFHFGSIDLEMIKERMSNNDLVSTGRLEHIKKRAKTIYVVTGVKAREWDKTVAGIRRVQQWMRQLFAWNKPWNPITKVVVRIPDRFTNII